MRYHMGPGWIALTIFAFILGCTVWAVRYRECRAHGFTAFYCLTQR